MTDGEQLFVHVDKIELLLTLETDAVKTTTS